MAEDEEEVTNLEFIQTESPDALDALFDGPFQVVYHPDWRWEVAFGEDNEGDSMAIGGAMCMLIANVIGSFTNDGEVDGEMLSGLAAVTGDLLRLLAHMTAVALNTGNLTLLEAEK